MRSVSASFAACSALSLALILTACGQTGTTTSTGGSVQCLKAQALPAGSLAARPLEAQSLMAQSLDAQQVTPAADWSAPHVPGEVLVVVARNLTAQSVQQNAQTLRGLSVEQVSETVQRVQTPAGETDQALAQRLSDNGLTTQPNFIYQALSIPNDPGYPGNAGVQVGSVTAHQDDLTTTQVPAAWATLSGCGLSPAGATTAFIDSAVDTTHADLQGKISAQAHFLMAGDTSTTDHGTATAGIFGAISNNGLGLSGITWNTPLISEEVLGNGGTDTASVTAALNDAVARGAKVINLSLGMIGNPGDAALDKAISAAAQSAVLVAAAGNTDKDGVYYPASNINVIAVGAVGKSTAQLACYSARPSAKLPRKLDIVAPGGNGYGRPCTGATQAGDLLILAPGNSYTLEAGTSFSAPQVAAVASLMRGANPNLSAAQTKSLLIDSANSASGLPLLDANAAVRAAIAAK